MLGFYPITCTNEYALLTPRVTSATLQLADSILTVTRDGEGPHLSAIERDGAPMNRAFLTHDELVDTGVLHFQQGSSSTTWQKIGD